MSRCATLEVTSQSHADKLARAAVKSSDKQSVLSEKVLEVDGKLQSLADQVVHIVGGEHTRLTHTERNVEYLVERTKTIHDELKGLKSIPLKGVSSLSAVRTYV